MLGYGSPPMAFGGLDWIVFGLYVGAALAIGLWAVRFAAKDSDSFFLAGRRLPWWLLGTSMVATTFSTDTPNLVAELVRQNGVAANWAWWAFCITGMLTVFVFAPLWRRSRLTTDLGFYEIRYAGKPAAFLRGFRAVYLGVFFNCVVIATVTLAGAKIGGVLFGLEKSTAVLIAGGLAAAYAVVAGFWGVVVTDLLQFVLSMVGAVVAAVWALGHPAVGGLSGLVEQFGDRLAIVPPTGTEAFAVLFVVPVALQWWSVWYPGAEPGGGGYIAQRMLAARSEKDALRGTLWFNIAHYTLRPWPWILVALASLAVYPDLAALRNALPGLDPALVGDDLAYPLMLRLLPPGLLGLAAASLAGAYMSTVDTHLNWGASYVVEDVYRRFFRPAAGASRVRGGGADRDRPADGGGGAAHPLHRHRPGRLRAAASDRSRDRAALHRPLAVVADQCLERDRRHGGIARGGGLPPAARDRTGIDPGARGRSRRHHGDLAGRHPADAGRAARDARSLRRAHPAAPGRLERRLRADPDASRTVRPCVPGVAGGVRDGLFGALRRRRRALRPRARGHAVVGGAGGRFRVRGLAPDARPYLSSSGAAGA